MTEHTSNNLKNLAIIAHVDHGKTTLMDALLGQTGQLKESADNERVLDSGELEKEKGITIRAKNCSIEWQGTKLNILDTPGHADFGGEVERSLLMVDGALLLVDAAEGPLPQTRFVLSKAMELGLKIIVIINKVDRPDQRVEEVHAEIEDLILELAVDAENEEDYLELPFVYASAKNGWACTDWPGSGGDMVPLLDMLVGDYFPPPRVSGEGHPELLVTNLSYSPYLGDQIVGRISQGALEKNTQYSLIAADNRTQFKLSAIHVFDGLGQKEVNVASAGEIVILSGCDKPHIGDTVTAADQFKALPRIEVSPPTVSAFISVNTSPFSGREGEYLTSRKLEEFLLSACKNNVALKYESTDDPKVFELKGRGELQLAIIFEELRRKGNEFMVSRPRVLYIEEEDGLKEPFEDVVLDIPADCMGDISETLSRRKGRMSNMVNLSEQRTRLEFRIPARGLIGYRSQFLTLTRGEGILSSHFAGYFPYAGDMLSRNQGAIVADRTGKSTPYALFNLLNLGAQFISPGMEVYEGMVVGEHTQQNDINVNCVREKHLSSVRTAGKDENIIIPPPKKVDIEWALSWIDQDEWVEITPENIRIRKTELASNKRTVIRKKN